MSVLGRSALEASPLADLHLIASELGIDGYRRLLKAELVDAIVARQGGDGEAEAKVEEVESAEAATTGEAGDEDDDEQASDGEDAGDRDEEGGGSASRSRTRRGGRRRGGRGRRGAEDDGDDAGGGRSAEEERVVEGAVELLGGGSGFVRVKPGEQSDEDVYISAAQIRRCELVDGDTVTGPVRPPRRSERFASLIRVDTINGRPADQVAGGTRYDDLPAAFPETRFALPSEDPTVKSIEWLTPIGRGSRVTIVGPSRAGKTETLARLAVALGNVEDAQVSVVLAGVRPEEVTAWKAGPMEPVAATTFADSADEQAKGIEHAVDQARRVAARGGDAVLLVDTLDGVSPSAARKALGAARNIVDGGSLTVIATSSEPVGGETTVIALDLAMASTGRFPAVDLVRSGTIRPDLLVGKAGADAIARARADAAGA